MPKYCDKCNVTVQGTMDYCPLCQNILVSDDKTGKDEKRIFPVIQTVYKQFENFFKLLILGTVAGGVISVAVNMLLPGTGMWSLFVIIGIVCFWIMLYIAIHRRFNIPKNIATQVFLISILSVFWDFITGWHGWSVDYVVPIACTIAMFSLQILGKVKKLPANEVMSCTLADACFGIIPIIFYFTGILNVSIPSIICVAVSIISLFAMFIFERKNMLLEIQKRFHI